MFEHEKKKEILAKRIHAVTPEMVDREPSILAWEIVRLFIKDPGMIGITTTPPKVGYALHKTQMDLSGFLSLMYLERELVRAISVKDVVNDLLILMEERGMTVVVHEGFDRT